MDLKTLVGGSGSISNGKALVATITTTSSVTREDAKILYTSYTDGISKALFIYMFALGTGSNAGLGTAIYNESLEQLEEKNEKAILSMLASLEVLGYDELVNQVGKICLDKLLNGGNSYAIANLIAGLGASAYTKLAKRLNLTYEFSNLFFKQTNIV